MIDHHPLFQSGRILAHAGIDGTAAYIEDMQRMHAVLGSAPLSFPWGTAALLSLLLLGWFAALAWGWIYLNRRALRQPPPAPDATGDLPAATSSLSAPA